MKKIGFVTPWFGENIPGGAEALLRGVATHLNQSSFKVEILTTCAKEFICDWSVNYYSEGVYTECGLTIRRFKVNSRDCESFDFVNGKLIKGVAITQEEEHIFVDNIINSSSLYDYIKTNSHEYSLFVFIPYMFGTTYFGCEICPEKSILIPCFHDESYAYLSVFKQRFSNVAGMLFNSEAESELAKRIFSLKNMYTEVVGAGLNSNIQYDKNRFDRKYKIGAPFMLYMGRKDTGKNVDVLMQYFAEYKKRKMSDLKLVLTGGGKIDIPNSIIQDVYDLGFIPIQDKYDACASATILCQPSSFESFSIVIMESWLCKRPVLVNGHCEVTRQFVIQANGGLYYYNYHEFEGCLNYFLLNEKIANKMGTNGLDFVMHNYTWDVVTNKYISFFEKVSKKIDE